jgi:hypothetical protein
MIHWRVAALTSVLGLLAPPAGLLAAERAVPFAVGETLTYDVSWTSYVTAGTVTVKVRGKKPLKDGSAWDVVVEAQPTSLLSKMYTLFYRVETLLDAQTLLPVRSVAYQEEGSRKRTKTTVFDHAAGKASYEVRIGSAVTRELAIPKYAQDVLSVFYVARTLVRLQQGDRLSLPVVDNGQVYTVQLTVGARESVQTATGTTVPAWRVVPRLATPAGPSKSLTLWLSDDPRRLPVRFQVEAPVGSFKVVLRDAVPPLAR